MVKRSALTSPCCPTGIPSLACHLPVQSDSKCCLLQEAQSLKASKNNAHEGFRVVHHLLLFRVVPVVEMYLNNHLSWTSMSHKTIL